jgi:hypothetical protein
MMGSSTFLMMPFRVARLQEEELRLELDLPQLLIGWAWKSGSERFHDRKPSSPAGKLAQSTIDINKAWPNGIQSTKTQARTCVFDPRPIPLLRIIGDDQLTSPGYRNCQDGLSRASSPTCLLCISGRP